MAYKFLTTADLQSQIIEQFLTERSAEPQTTILEALELQNIAIIKTKLKGRFDIDAIFEAKNADRHYLIIRILIKLVLYDFIRRNAARKVPADYVKAYCLGVSTVPAPIIASGKAILSCLMAFNPYSLRRVISNTVSPPLTNAVQTPRACSAFSRVSTGTTGALAHITSMRALLACMR